MPKADNLTTPCAVIMKSDNLNSLELSVPLQACNGTALPFFTILLLPVIILGLMYGFGYVVDNTQPINVKKTNRQQNYIRCAKLVNCSL